MSDVRTYQVEYLITMQDRASTALNDLARKAAELETPLKTLKGHILDIGRTLRVLKESSSSLVVTPTVDMTTATTQFKALEDAASTTARNISKIMSNALKGVAPATKTKADYQKEIDAKLAKTKVVLKGEADALRDQIEGLKQLKKKAPASAKNSSSPLIAYTDLTNNVNKLNAVADGIKSINTAVKGLKRSKSHAITITADISPAVAKINTLLETIRTSTAALPITATNAANASKGGKISEKTGKLTKTGAANVKSAPRNVVDIIPKESKAKGKNGKITAKLDSAPLVGQLTESVGKLQELAKTKPVVLKSSFNGSDANFQLNNSLARLQELANTKPIIIRGVFNGSDASFQLNNNLANLQRTAQTKPIVPATKPQPNKGKATRSTMSDGEARAERMASISNANQLRRLALLNSKDSDFANDYYQKPNKGDISHISSTPSSSQKQSLYARARQFLYPLTGNTSFGARTPMAVDMAKGMGTMFAIGGAMSAVGSSLSQSVHYQNIMKTTQAILENGTSNYSDSGFKNMEQVVRQVGKETKFTAPQVASAAKFLAMAGYDIPSIKSAINPVANIALIGDTNLGETADKLTNVMTTFGIDPKDMNNIADIMTSTFTRSNTDMMMLAESAKYAGGIAHLYGRNFQNNFSDVMAMFGVLGNAGIQASSAGTTLRMMYQNLMQPNKNQKKTLEHYGISTRDASGAPLEMIEILKQIYAKVPQAQLADAVGNMFRITAQPGAAALVQSIGSGKLVELMQANRASAGSGVSQTIADEKKNTLSGLWAQVESTFTEGILQALENREGGWAGELMKLRDYLAKPETIQMLSSIVDMVEQLVRTMATFAKIYAKIYSMFPGLINGWMHFQLLMTQLGYLGTPIIQLMSILDRLNTILFSTAAAATAATVAEKGKKAAIAGGEIAGMSRFASYAQSGKKERDYLLYSSGMAYWMNKRGAAKDVANRYGGRALSAFKENTPKGYAKMIAKNPVLAATLGQSSLLGLEAYSRRYPNAKISKDFSMAQRAAGKASIAAQRMSELKKQYHEQLRAVRRPDQMMNRALIDRYECMGGDAILIADARARIAERDARIAPIAAARHANRGPIDSAVRNRFAQRYGWKRASKMTWSNSLSAGRALGTLSFASMFTGIKSMALSLFSGLAKAIGLLVSPVGLVTIAIGGLAAIAYKVYKDYKKYQANTKLANENQKRIVQQVNDVNNLYNSVGNDIYGIKPLNINLSKSESESNKPTISLANNKIVSDLLNKDKTDGLTGSYIADKYVSKFKYLPSNYISDYYNNNQDYSYTKKYDRTIGDYVTARHELPSAKDNAIKLGIVAQWASLATKQEDVKNALVKVQTAIRNKDFNLAQRIVASYKPISNMSMLTGRDANAISKIQDPTKYYEWQYAQYRMLADSLTAETNASKYSYALDLINNFKESSANDKKNYDGTALAQALIQSIPVSINGTKASFNLDKMGRIDWVSLAKSVNDGIPFTIGQQADIMGNVYEAIYNDPNIKNVSSVIDLLQTYLPQIANVSSPYSGYSWSEWGEDADRDKQRREKNMEQTIQVPFAAQSPSLANPSWGTPNSILGVSTVSVPTMTSDWNKTLSENNNSPILASVAYHQKYPERFPQVTSPTNNLINNGNNNTKNRYDPSEDKKKQKDYASTYGRNAAKPTQVIIHIDKLANFDKTTISNNANERAITEAIETKIAESVSMLSAQILTSASATISQGLN